MKTKISETAGRHHLDAESKAVQRKSMRSARWLLGGHRRRKHQPTHALDSKAFNQLRAPELRADDAEPSRSFTKVMSERLPVGNRKPLLDAAEVTKETGLVLGSLQAIVHPVGDSPRLLCFDRSTYTPEGKREAAYLIVTDDQLNQIQQSEATGFPSRDSIKNQIVSLKSGSRNVVSDRHPMPGKSLKPNTPLYADHDRLANPSLAGETVVGVTNLVAYPILYVEDLGSPNGIIVEHNAELMAPQDPWPHAPMGPKY